MRSRSVHRRHIRPAAVLAACSLALLAGGAAHPATPQTVDRFQGTHKWIASSYGPSPAHAPAQGDNGATGEVITQEAEAEMRLSEAKGLIEDAAAKSGVDGLATVNIDFKTSHLHVHWKGHLPELVSRAVETVRKDFQVEVHAARYTWKQVDKEIRRILALIKSRKELAIVKAVAMESDVSGIQLIVANQQQLSDVAKSAARSAISSALPLRFTVDESAGRFKPSSSRGDAADPTRWNDTAPFYGAAAIERDVYGGHKRCTSGFTYRKGTDLRGVFGAKHCGSGASQEKWWTPGRAFVGWANVEFGDRDLMALQWKTSQAGYPGFSGRVYIGGYNSSDTGGVTGSGSPTEGATTYCVSAAFSGTTCFNKVTQTNYYDPEFGGPLFKTSHQYGDAVAGNGDSGGATFAVATGARSARGIVVAHDLNSIKPCRGIPSDAPERTCSDNVLHVEVQKALQQMNAAVLTSSW